MEEPGLRMRLGKIHVAAQVDRNACRALSMPTAGSTELSTPKIQYSTIMPAAAHCITR